MFTTMEKGAIDIKNTPDYIQYADAQNKIPFYEKVSDLT